MAKLRDFFQNSETTFSKRFFLNFFFNVFCANLKERTPKNYWKLNTSVLLSTSWILQFFVHFGAFFLLCSLVSIIFTIIVMGSEVCLERCDSYGNFGFLKIQTFLF